MRLAMSATLALTTLVFTATATAADWPHWRGASYNGTSTATNLPVEWSATKNVRWSVPMPGGSSATPIVSGDYVFAVSNSEDMESLYAIALDRNTGVELWRKTVSTNGRKVRRNTLASSSPVTDGKAVYFTFATGDIIACNYDGSEVWTRNLEDDLGPIGQQFGYSSSPFLLDGRLYYALLHGQWHTGNSQSSFTDKDSLLLCLDAANGEDVWRVHRPSDANGESFDSYASPMPYPLNNPTQLVVQGGDFLSAHNLSDGAELWRQGHNPTKGGNWRLIPSPVVAEKFVIGAQPRGGPMFGILPGDQKRINFLKSTWIYNEKTTDVPTPVYHDGRLYVLNGVRGIMMCLDPTTGKELWKGDLENRDRIWSSPTSADGKIYCYNELGATIVLATGDAFNILARNPALDDGDPSKSSIAIAGDSLFIRTPKAVYCIANEG
jgi:outer membrane protein assembly factor BamB